MVSLMHLRADAVLVQLVSRFDVAFLRLAIEHELERERRLGVQGDRLAGFVELAGELGAVVAARPDAEVVAEVSASDGDEAASDDRPWFTTQEAAGRLGAAGVRGGDRWVRQLLRDGRLNGRRERGRLLVEPRSLDRYITERTTAA